MNRFPFSAISPATLAVAVASIVSSCQSNEIGYAKDVNPETIYQEYEIRFDGNTGEVQCYAQLRFAGENGTTLVLGEPGSILLDGNALRVDSSDGIGAYYEFKTAAREFDGRHSWEYLAENGKKYTNNFQFSVIELLPKNHDIGKGSMELGIKGLQDGEKINLVLSDTSNGSDALDSAFVVKNAAVEIPAVYFEHLKRGPVMLRGSYFKNTPLEEQTTEGGALVFNYDLKTVALQKP